MSSAWIGGVFALAGVLLAQLGQFLTSRRTERLSIDRTRRKEREQAYAAVLTQLEKARRAALFAAAPSNLAGLASVLDRVSASMAALSSLEEASFRAWLLAGPTMRATLDELTASARATANVWFDKKTADNNPWPAAIALREAMRQELTDVA